MRIEDVIDRIGAGRFQAACRMAHATAPGTGTRRDLRVWPDGLADVPHDCADLWDDDDTPIAERLDVALELYTRMPCYGNLMYLPGRYADLGPGGRERLWRFYRCAADGDDAALADPVLYSLWVDFFEDADTVQDAWSAMTDTGTGDARHRIDRVLHHAGPVPWPLKAPLLETLLEDPTRHAAVHAALVGSAFDVYGHMDDTAARAIHRRLTIDADLPGAGALATRLRPS